MGKVFYILIEFQSKYHELGEFFDFRIFKTIQFCCCILFSCLFLCKVKAIRCIFLFVCPEMLFFPEARGGLLNDYAFIFLSF